MSRAGSHTICRRCGKHSYSLKRKSCVSCGFNRTAKFNKAR